MAEISPGELKQRVAVIKRFKELLKTQRDRFNAYLETLDRQKDIIETGSADDLLRHVELEEKIVTDIFSIQKVIEPLEKMYYSAKSSGAAKSAALPKSALLPKEEAHSGDAEVSSLKEALDGLKAEAVIRSGRNRELLSRRMSELRSEIKTARSNPYARRTSESTAKSTLIDLNG